MAIDGNAIQADVNSIVSAARSKVHDRFELSENMVNNFYELLESALGTLTNALEDIKQQSVNVSIGSPGNPPNHDQLRQQIPDIAAIEAEIMNIIAAIEDLTPPDSPDLKDVDTVDPEELPARPSDKPTITPPTDPADFNEDDPEMQQINPPQMPVDLESILAENPKDNKPNIQPKTFDPHPGYTYHELTLATDPSLSQRTPNAPPQINAPSLTKGTAPTIAPLGAISEPDYQIPSTIDPLNVSDLQFNYPTLDYSETPYTSTIKARIEEYVLDVLNNGGTGVNTAVENALFERDIERANQAVADAKNKAVSEWTGRGFEMPDDDIMDTLTRIDTEFLMKRLEVSRDILVKAWELEQANVFKSLDVATALETQLIMYANNVAQRAFEALKAGADIALQINDMEIKRGNYKLEVFKAKLIEWEGLLKAEFAKIDIYKARLEAQKTGVEISRLQLETYKTEVEVNIAEFEADLKVELARLEIYKSELEGIKISSEVDQGKIAVYKIETEANIAVLDAKIKSEMAKMEIYNKYLEGEKMNLTVDQLNVELFGKEVGLYQTRIDAAKAAIQAKVAEFEFEQYKLEVFKADVQLYLAKVQLKTAEYQWMQAKISGEDSKVKLWATEVDAYKAEISAIESRQGIAVENMKALLTYNDGLLKKQAEETQVYKIQSETGLQKAEVGIKGITAEADVFKGIAAAYESLGNLAVKEYDANIQEAIAKAQIEVKNAEIEINNYEKLKVLLISTLQSTTQVLAQCVAGALASVSAQASISARGGADEGLNYTLNATEE